MEKETKLVKKLKRLLKRLGMPRWLHRYGPKSYELVHHLAGLLIRAYAHLSYRRVVKLFDLLGIKCPSKSALQYTAAKLNTNFWSRILKSTSGQTYIAAIDGTGFSRTHPSYYYLKRIDGKMPRVPVKMSVAFDTRKKKFCAAKLRVLASHDIKDAKTLIKKSKPKILVADKAYDALWLHQFCSQRKIKAHIPLRKWSKPRFKNMGARMKAAKHFRTRTYHRRELVEASFSSIKRKYGTSVSSRSARTIRAELYGRLACHNIFSFKI